MVRVPSQEIESTVASPQPPLRVLVADHEASVRESCVGILRLGGYEVAQCGRGEEALQLLNRYAFDIVLAEEGMRPVTGWTVLRAAQASHPDCMVIMTTADPTVESGEQAMRMGAWYYLPKPFTATQLQILVGRAAYARGSAQESASVPWPEPTSPSVIPLVGRAPAFQQAVELARRVAPTDVPVLLSGESGSGKELLAQFIHRESGRAGRPLVSVNCAALPDGLLESEMFGHRKGAFTGAVREKPGLLETADGGTMFLDEMLDMAKPTQAKLLRVLQDGVVRRVGSETTDAVVNVRFIAATNGDTADSVRAGRLRKDLYYRLNVVSIRLPPLRERPDDIPVLANLFLATYWRRNRPKGFPVPKLSDGAVQALREHPWRGNVRELQNVIECTSVLVAPGQEIGPDELPLLGEPPARLAMTDTLLETPLDDTLQAARARFVARFELEYLRWLLDKTEGNVAEAARLAGVDRTTLYRMLSRRGLDTGRTTSAIRGAVERRRASTGELPEVRALEGAA